MNYYKKQLMTYKQKNPEPKIQHFVYFSLFFRRCNKRKNGASQSLRAPFTFITNTNSNYSIKWKKRKTLTITKRMQI